MSQLLAAQQSGTESARVLELIGQKVPTLKGEVGWEKGDHDTLAGLLMDVAEGMIKKADAEPAVDGKEALINQLATAQQLLQEPEFVPNAVRTKLQTRLAGLGEDRARVLRDINRDRRLAATMVAMEEAIAARDPVTAYGARQSLIREYPRLVDKPELVELVKRASAVQRELVQTGGPSLAIAREARESIVRKSVVLANRQGDRIESLAGRPVYLRAGDSILALDAGSGALQWRQSVGTGDDAPPVPLGDRPAEGVLLTDLQHQELLKLDGSDGKLLWRAAVGTPFAPPTVGNNQVFLSASDGRVMALTPNSGETQWNTLLPQPITVSPGAAGRGQATYVVAEHSNVYVLNVETGDCPQAYYVGHGPSTVRVPPIVLLGHLFVAENAGVDYSLLHILRLDAETGQIVAQQSPLRLTGNVVAPPQIVGRRLIVLTDRNQITVLDVEPTAAGDQVSRVAEQLAGDEPPLASQFEAAEGQVWVAGNRLARYELQMAAGKVVRDWVEYEGDVFSTAPQQVGEILIHARTVRGTEGIRVSAVDPATGKPRWQTDVAVPIAALSVDPADPTKSYVISAQAALYRLDETAETGGGALNEPLENPGRDNRLMRFGAATALADGASVLLNEFAAGQLALFDPKRSEGRLRLVTLDLGSGKPSSPPLATSGGLLVPLDNGRIALVDVVTGRVRSSFQPPAAPNQVVRWARPALVPSDPTQVVAADDQNRIFRLRADEQLREVAKADLDRRPLGPLAIAGQSVFLASGGAASDVLAVYALNDLKLKQEIALEGHVTWGPVAVGDSILVASDREGLLSFDSAGQRDWVTPLENFTPQDNPVRLPDGSLLLYQGPLGELLQLRPDTGELLGRVSIGQAISAAPLATGNRLLVPGADGTVYLTNLPAEAKP
jgi:outer membrane protein assembly factor BamB